MMKYMDREMMEKEAVQLNEHILLCKECRETFFVYDSMILDIENVNQVAAPENFEKAVLAKIAHLPAKEHIYSREDKLRAVVASVFVFFLSLGTALVVYQEQIVTYLVQNQSTADYIMAFSPVAVAVENHTKNLLSFTEMAVAQVERVISAGAWIIGLSIVAVCTIQFSIAKRRNR